MSRIHSWDIFCTVIDNFGDIGVCWRLARQLAQEHGHRVRLWVDDLHSFARLAPQLDPKAPHQSVAGVDIRPWLPGDHDAAAFAGVVPHDVVIEAFACDLPETFVQQMAGAPVPPVWINLEYLSAEAWVREHHGMVSPHPRLPLRKYFFFPGFEPGTGGVLREAQLGGQRRHFETSGTAQALLWHRLGVQPLEGALRVSLFAYANPALPALLRHWRDGADAVQCLVPPGPAALQAFAWAGAAAPSVGASASAGALRLHLVPFQRQEQFDELLWACDINFVRGEDSFVRAQWAARPFVWHIYPQADDAHRIKLEAFLALYRQQFGKVEDAAALQRFWLGWNGVASCDDIGTAWDAFLAARQGLSRTAQRWHHSLTAIGDLAANLVAFCESRVK